MICCVFEFFDFKIFFFIFDVGCGFGFLGEIFFDIFFEEGGFYVWIGMDIFFFMFDVVLQCDVEGDLFFVDIGQGVFFCVGIFDVVISISVIQWFCNVESSEIFFQQRLVRFFGGLYQSLKWGGRVVCQFYLKNDVQKQMIIFVVVKVGFGVGMFEDDFDMKNVKVYLVLMVGQSVVVNIKSGDIIGVVENMEGVDVVDNWRQGRLFGKGEIKKGSKQWIIKKKEQMERKGKVVKIMSKYMGWKCWIVFQMMGDLLFWYGFGWVFWNGVWVIKVWFLLFCYLLC